MSRNTPAPRNYNAVDIARFALVLVIVCAHFASPGGRFHPLIDDAFSIDVIGVPFFYACSAYFFFKKIIASDVRHRSQAMWKYAKRLILMYLSWSGIYFVFVVIGWLQVQPDMAVILTYFHRALVFTTYATIWFLPALLIGVAMVYGLSLRLSFPSILAVSMVFYFLGSLGYSYSFLLHGMPKIESVYQIYDRLFFTTRNGVFNAFPFAAIGAWMATRKSHIPSMYSAFVSLFFIGLLVIEAYILRLKFGARGVDTAFSLLPFTFFFLEFLLSAELRDRAFYGYLRKMSILIFLSHRLYVSALPSILPEALVAEVFRNAWATLSGIILLTLVQSWFIIKFSDKYRFFRMLR